MKKHVMLAVACSMLAACVSQQKTAIPRTGELFNPSQLSTQHLNNERALAVFYRQADVQGNSTNIFVNGDYQASLAENTYSVIPVCLNSLMSTSYVTNQQFGNRTDGLENKLSAKEVVFIKVSQGRNGQPVLERVAENIALPQVKELRNAVHTHSRVNQVSCEQRILGKVSLSAGALFNLDKSSYQEMLPKGKQEIKAFAQTLNTKNVGVVEKIIVSGYTDPTGSDQHNMKLSQARAETVRRALQVEGVKYPIEAIGYGKANLVVSDCEALHAKNFKAKTICNEPNRRVEITIYGRNK